MELVNEWFPTVHLDLRTDPSWNFIYIKVFTDGIFSHPTVSTDDVPNTTNNETAFPELTRACKEHFEMKFQEGYVLKYLNF